MKLKFYIDSKGEKIYTLNEEIKGKKTNDAHYKFVKVKNAPIQNSLKSKRKANLYSNS